MKFLGVLASLLFLLMLAVPVLAEILISGEDAKTNMGLNSLAIPTNESQFSGIFISGEGARGTWTLNTVAIPTNKSGFSDIFISGEDARTDMGLDSLAISANKSEFVDVFVSGEDARDIWALNTVSIPTNKSGFADIFISGEDARTNMGLNNLAIPTNKSEFADIFVSGEDARDTWALNTVSIPTNKSGFADIFVSGEDARTIVILNNVTISTNKSEFTDIFISGENARTILTLNEPPNRTNESHSAEIFISGEDARTMITLNAVEIPTNKSWFLDIFISGEDARTEILLPYVAVTTNKSEIANIFISGAAASKDIVLLGLNSSTNKEYNTTVTNCQQLQAMQYNLSAHYVLINDINCSDTVNWNSGHGFKPVGAYSNPFTGVFDGNNYTITGLYMNWPTQYRNVGLFGSLSGAEIVNVGLENVDIRGYNSYSGSTGGLSGHTKESTTVTNCYSTGKVHGFDHVGGLLGQIYDTVVEYSFSSVDVSGTNSIGGLIGQHWSGSIAMCYATSNVTGTQLVGGLVAQNLDKAHIINSYATGSVNGTILVGGLTGQNKDGSEIINSYSTGKVTGGSDTGGLVGRNEGSTINNSYWDHETSGQASSAGGTGKTSAEMKQKSTFADWDFENVWNITAGINYGYPYFIFSGNYQQTICGNDICEDGENYHTCPEDCRILEYMMFAFKDKQSYLLNETVNLRGYVLGTDNKTYYYLSEEDVNVTVTVLNSTNHVVVGPISAYIMQSQLYTMFNVSINDLDKGDFKAVFIATNSSGDEVANAMLNFTVDNDFAISVFTNHKIYNRRGNIIISGRVKSVNNDSLANESVRIDIYHKGYARSFRTISDSEGYYEYTFSPFSSEAGHYILNVSATRNSIIRRNSTTFDIVGLKMEPQQIIIGMSKNSQKNVTVRLTNIGGMNLTGINISLDRYSKDNVSIQLDTSSIPKVLQSGRSCVFVMRIIADTDASSNAQFRFFANSDQNIAEQGAITINLYPAIPIAEIDPVHIEMALNPSNISLNTITITNTWYGTMKDVILTESLIPWIKITSDLNLGDIAPEQSKTFEISIQPPEDTPKDIYFDYVTIESSNHITMYTYQTIYVTPSQNGSLIFHVTDIFGNNISNAEIKLYDLELYTLVYTNNTGSTGEASFNNIPAGKYSYAVTSADGDPAYGDVTVEPLPYPKPVNVSLSVSIVNVNWIVRPTTIPDYYIIDMNMTFDTTIPAPVLISMPPTIYRTLLPGENVDGGIEILNLGLISVHNVSINLASCHESMNISLATDIIPEIKAKSSVIIPYNVILSRNVTLGSHLYGTVDATGTFIHVNGSQRLDGTAKVTIPFDVTVSNKRGLRIDPSLIFLYDLSGVGLLPTTPWDTKLSKDVLRAKNVVNEDIALSIAIGGAINIDIVKAILALKGMPVGNPLGATGFNGTFIPDYIVPNETASLSLTDIPLMVGWSISPTIGGGLLGFYAYRQETKVGEPYFVPILKFSANIVGNIIYVMQHYPYSPSGHSPYPYGASSYPNHPGGGDPGSPGGGTEVNSTYSESYTPPQPSSTVIIGPVRPRILRSYNIHERVKISLSQNVTLERDAFDATLEITNIMRSNNISNVSIDVIIQNTDGENVNDIFFIDVKQMDELEDINGSGVIMPRATSTIDWLIIPEIGAGGIMPEGVRYDILANITYVVNGKKFYFETLKENIVVKPQPNITLDYYLPQTVKADTPFKLAVRVTNNGYGPAKKFKIDTAQPKIVENIAGLLIDFKITNCTVLDNPAPKMLQMDFGDVQPHDTQIGYCNMITTLDGNFTEFTARFTHSDALGGESTSLISHVNTHIILWDNIRCRYPIDNVTYCFLVDSNKDGFPDVITDLTTGGHEPTKVVNYTIIKEPSPSSQTLIVQTEKEDGWIFFDVFDPNLNQLKILNVIRSDGVVLDSYQYKMEYGRIYIVDDPTENYTVIYQTPEELCDGLDNDGDGGIDEDFPELGEVCVIGIGECACTGEYVCTTDKLGTECSAIPGTPSDELCDGLDNNCDGQTDEDFDQDDCSENCDYTWTALGGNSNCCGDDNGEGNPYENTENSCNDSQDNDCDGYIDMDDSDCIAEPMCNDSINNGDETGIDCGGNCPNQDCCTNGYQDANLGEEGIDCGGVCPACADPAHITIIPSNKNIIPENTGYTTAKVSPDGIYSLEIKDLICKNPDGNGNCNLYLLNSNNGEISIEFEDSGNSSTTTDSNGEAAIKITLTSLATEGAIYEYYVRVSGGEWVKAFVTAQTTEVPEFPLTVIPASLAMMLYVFVRRMP